LNESLFAVGRGHDGEAFLLQVQPKEFDDVALVVDDEDGFHSLRIRPQVCTPRDFCKPQVRRSRAATGTG
jgi:hypothetical protein